MSLQIYLRCHLKAVAEGAGSTAGKACSYDRVAAAWRSLDGVDCSCCGSPSGCRGRRWRRRAGSGGKRTPLVGSVTPTGGDARTQQRLMDFSLQVSWGKPVSTSVLWGYSRLCPACPRSPRGLPRYRSPTHHPLAAPRSPWCVGRRRTRVSVSCPVVLGGGRGDPAVPLTPLPLPAGLPLPVPGTTLAIVAMCSILAAVSMTGCYCSMRRHRSGHEVGGPEAAPGEPRAVAMAPTAASGARATPGTPLAPTDPAIV